LKVYFNENINDYIYDAEIPKWRVIDVYPQKDYTLHLTFIGGEKRIYDARPLLEKPVYFPLKSISFFMSAKVAGDSVTWNNDIDIAPEHLYEQSDSIIMHE